MDLKLASKLVFAVAIAQLTTYGSGQSQECYVGGTDGYALPPTLTNPANGLCPPGFYCPNSFITDPATFPRYCPPTAACIAARAEGEYCGPQGPFEPIPCPAGSYCPTGYEKMECPSGHWCPLGTIAPYKCNGLMHCPAGQTTPPYDFSSVLVTVLLDILIALGVVLIIRRRRSWWGWMDDIFEEQTCVEEIEARAEASRIKQKAMEEAEKETLGSRRGSKNHFPDAASTDGCAVVEMSESAAAIINQSHRDAIRGSPSYAILERGIKANRYQMMPIHIAFDQLSVVVPFKGESKQLLKGITGAIVPGHVTAIMGPSGAGKTVFMTSLLNKVESNWKLTGKLTINGLEGSTLSDYQHMMGYVPQDDIMHPELTVMENIWFSGEARLPRAWTTEDRLRYVAAVIKATGLEEVKHVVVGDGSMPNGVNRKRVCVAIELAAAPSALFLDEPTTGLDAATALDLCSLLKDIAIRSSLTIAMVIHQPRVEIWESLDEVLLIAPGGRTVYQGPQAEACEYFTRNIGLDFATGNPADVILDGIAANQEACEKAWEQFIIQNPHRAATDASSEVASNPMTAEAAQHQRTPSTSEPQRQHSRAEDNPQVAAFLRDVEDENRAAGNRSGRLDPHAPIPAHATFLRQLVLTHYRSILKQSAHIKSILLGIILSLAAAAVMGTAGVQTVNVGMLISPYSLLNPKHTVYLIPMLMMFYTIAIGCSTSASSIRALGEDRQQYWKEAATGRTNKVAYFIAMTTAEIYRLLLTAKHFSLVTYFMWNPLVQYWWFFFVILLTFFANDSQGAMLGLIISPKHAPLLCTVAAIFVALLNGFPDIPGIYWIGYPYYLTEVMINRYIIYQERVMTNEVYEEGYFRYDVHRIGMDIGIVIGIIVLYRVVAFLIMTLTNRNKQR